MPNTTPNTTSFVQQYELQHRLGNGHSGKVYQCIERSTGTRYAVKFFHKLGKGNAGGKVPNFHSCPYREASILVSLEHPNILKVRDVLTEDRKTYMILELASRGSLWSRLAKRGKLSEIEAQHVFKQLFEGLNYLVS